VKIIGNFCIIVYNMKTKTHSDL